MQKPKTKKQVKKEEQHLYDYVEKRTEQSAKQAAELINASFSNKGGIIFIEGPKSSGKTLMALKLARLIDKKRRLVLAQPKLDRPDIVNGYFYSRNGLRRKAVSFSTQKDLQEIFDEHDVVLVDEVMFIPYAMQGYFLAEVASFVERGGWFVGMGLLWVGQKTEFMISSLLLQRADKVYRLTATCQKCGRRNAVIGQRLVDGKPPSLGDPEILPPGKGVSYEPRCFGCFVVYS